MLDAVDVLNKVIADLREENEDLRERCDKLLNIAKFLGQESQGWKISESQCGRQFDILSEKNDALREYTQHHLSCPRNNSAGAKCECGLDELLKEIA